MWLLNVVTLELEEFIGDNIPRYAILSHTWGEEEVTFVEWGSASPPMHKAGYSKIRGACSETIRRGLNYLWVDTICIDKSSSAELSEAINSMFEWYLRSAVCLVYLVDVDAFVGANSRINQFRRSRWFTRGWTLQELLAPNNLEFFGQDWVHLSSMTNAMRTEISEITGIAESRLIGSARFLHNASVAERMSWMAGRTTTRVEDLAYCLLGIFDITMPLLYGEGPRAFLRLQEEIIKTSADQSIFCWENNRSPSYGVLAPFPSAFRASASFRPSKHLLYDNSVVPYVVNNVGISLELRVMHLHSGGVLAVLDVTPGGSPLRLAVRLHRFGGSGSYGRYRQGINRPIPVLDIDGPGSLFEKAPSTLLYRPPRGLIEEAFAERHKPLRPLDPRDDIPEVLTVAFTSAVHICWYAELENSSFNVTSGELSPSSEEKPVGGVLLGIRTGKSHMLFTVLIANTSEDESSPPCWAVGGHRIDNPTGERSFKQPGALSVSFEAMHLRIPMQREQLDHDERYLESDPDDRSAVIAYEWIKGSVFARSYLLLVDLFNPPEELRSIKRFSDLTRLGVADGISPRFYTDLLQPDLLWDRWKKTL